MSLLRDYLEKTTPQASQGRDVQVPPMLRQDKKSGMAGLRRLIPAMVVLFVILFFSGYIFKASFEELTAHPPAIVPRAEAAPEVSIPIVTDGPTTSVALGTALGETKPGIQAPVIRESIPLPVMAPLPVTAQPPSPVEVVKQATNILQTKTPESLRIEEKIQAAMAANKPEIIKSEISKPQTLELQNTVVPKPYTKKTVADADDYFNLGLAAQKRGSLSQALGYYRKVLNLEPDHSKALLNLSAIHIKTGNTARAMSILDKLHRQEPENVDAMVNLGILFLKENNYDRAEALFEKALDLQGHNTTVLFNLAYLNQLWNRLERARDFYTRVSSIDRDNTKALLATGYILEKQNNLSQALGCYVQALDTTKVKDSEPMRLKIETRIRLLQQIATNADHMTINPEETHD